MTPEHLAAILLRRAFHLVGTAGDIKSDVTTGLNAVMPTPSAAQPQPAPEGLYGKVVGALEGARKAAELPTSGDIQKKAEIWSPWLAQIMAAAKNAGGGSSFGALGGVPPPQPSVPLPAAYDAI